MGDAGRPRLDEATRAALLGQFAVEQLLLGLALVEGFMLDVVVVPTARVALSVRWLLEEELPERRADALEIRVLAPNPARASAFAPVEAEELLERVLAPLMAPPAAKPGVLTLTWIDAATARPEDEPAWTTLFHRFNERRNAITEGLKGPLLVVLPPRMEAVFAHAAPDAWSVRSGVHRVKLADLETHAIDVDPERRPSLVEGAPRGSRRHLNLTLAMESEEPARFDDASRSWAFSESVAQLLARGALDEAEAASRAALTRAEATKERAPDSVEAAWSLSRALASAAHLANAMGDDAEARRLCVRRATLAKQLLAAQGESPSWLLSLADASSMLATVSDGEASVAAALAGVQAARDARLIAPDDERTKEQLLHSLAALGQAALRTNRLAESEAALHEAVTLIEELNNRPRQNDWTLALAIVSTHGLRADLSGRVGRFEEALTDARKALDIAESLRSRTPHHIVALRHKAVAARCLASIYASAGDLTRAEATLAVDREVTREMTRRWPQSAASIALRIEALEESAEVALEARDTRHLASWLDELDRLRDAIARHNPADPALDLLASSIATLRARWKALEESTAPPTS